MTDRARHLYVILTEDMRVDDVQEVVKAISQNRYVADVIVGTPPDDMHRAVAKSELKRELTDSILNLLEFSGPVYSSRRQLDE